MIRRRLMRPEKLASAKHMRRSPTPAELLLWQSLKCRQLGAKARRQAPMWGYIADFYFPEHALIVEVDGGYHRVDTDNARDDHLYARGIRTLRFSNEQVLKNIGPVLASIRDSFIA